MSRGQRRDQCSLVPEPACHCDRFRGERLAALVFVWKGQIHCQTREQNRATSAGLGWHRLERLFQQHPVARTEVRRLEVPLPEPNRRPSKLVELSATLG